MRDTSRVEVLRTTTYLLLRLGFQASQRGYRYLREAVWVAYEDPEMVTSVTKLLYPEIAKRFSTTDKQVERAIRNSIETAWAKGNHDSLKSVFYTCYKEGNGRPTNTEVIETLVKYIEDSAWSEAAEG